jgi:hypothetical protein
MIGSKSTDFNHRRRKYFHLQSLEVLEPILLPPRSLIRAKLLRDCVGNATRCGAVLIAAIGFTSVASPPDGLSTSLNQQEILQFLTRTMDWYQHQSLDHATLASPDDIAFVNENQPAADQVIHLSFDFARASAQLLRNNLNPAPTDSR